jgi:site-specific DNA-cytosine methylase
VDAFNQKVNNSGVSPTVTTRPEGFKTAVLVVDEPIVYDGFNGQVRTDSSTIGTITRNVGADLKRNGQGIIEPLSEYELSETMKKYINSYDDKYQVSDSKLVLNKKVETPITTREGCSRADSSTYVSPNFPEQNIARMDVTPFRVRKLTERECFRLQGVKDTDFAKVRQTQSKSSCYHLAGDSITTSVLMALFGQMLGIDWRRKVDELVEEIKK